MTSLSDFSVDDLVDFLLEKGVCEDVAENFRKNRVSGTAFLKLTEEDLKELVPIIGVRTEVRDILAESKTVSLATITDLDIASFVFVCVKSVTNRSDKSRIVV